MPDASLDAHDNQAALRGFKADIDRGIRCRLHDTVAIKLEIVGRRVIEPIALHATTPTQLVIGGSNTVFESLNQGTTLAAVAVAGGVLAAVTALAYGHSGNANLLLVADASGQLFLRNVGANLNLVAAWTNGTALDIVLDPADWRRVYIVTRTTVFRTNDVSVACRSPGWAIQLMVCA